MASVLSSEATSQSRREDFSIDSFRHLEGKLQVIRRMVMERAVTVAMNSSSDVVVRITPKDVDFALKEVLNAPAEALRSVGLSNGNPH
jgi:hypothetical protein